MTKAPAVPPANQFELGWQHFLIGLHTPNRMGTSYPTQDRHGPADEAEFIRGWHAAMAEREALLAEVATFGQHQFD